MSILFSCLLLVPFKSQRPSEFRPSLVEAGGPASARSCERNATSSQKCVIKLSLYRRRENLSILRFDFISSHFKSFNFFLRLQKTLNSLQKLLFPLLLTPRAAIGLSQEPPLGRVQVGSSPELRLTVQRRPKKSLFLRIKMKLERN